MAAVTSAARGAAGSATGAAAARGRALQVVADVTAEDLAVASAAPAGRRRRTGSKWRSARACGRSWTLTPSRTVGDAVLADATDASDGVDRLHLLQLRLLLVAVVVDRTASRMEGVDRSTRARSGGMRRRRRRAARRRARRKTGRRRARRAARARTRSTRTSMASSGSCGRQTSTPRACPSRPGSATSRR